MKNTNNKVVNYTRSTILEPVGHTTPLTQSRACRDYSIKNNLDEDFISVLSKATAKFESKLIGQRIKAGIARKKLEKEQVMNSVSVNKNR